MRALGLERLRLAVVHEHAARKVEGLVSVDEVEVYLAYETKLARRLNLPIAIQRMLYGAPVTDHDLARAADDAKAATADPLRVEAFLQAWPPWQRLERRTQAAAVRWDALPEARATAAYRASVCVLTQEPLAELQEPVTLGGTGFAAELSELLTWWQERGTHPAHTTPLALDQLRRLTGG